MKTVMLAAMVWAGVAAAGAKEDAAAARAEVEKMVGFVPEYFKAVPDVALPGLWQEMKTLQTSSDTALKKPTTPYRPSINPRITPRTAAAPCC